MSIKRRMMHKFRFQLMAEWIDQTFEKGKVADVGGGKGLLAYILLQRGWEAVVIDPVWQKLHYKFKDLERGKMVKLTHEEQMKVPRINTVFEEDMGEDFDLMVGMHAHGANMKILKAAAIYKKRFALLPCCVVDEPIVKQPGINWFESLVEHATSLGLQPNVTTLSFVGQNKVIYG